MKDLLGETIKGKQVLEYGNEHKKFLSEHRDCIINIIIEDVFYNAKELCVQDFKRLVDQICNIFPFETDAKVSTLTSSSSFQF